MGTNFLKIANGISLTPLASAPSSPNEGDIYYDTSLVAVRIYQNGGWVSSSGGPASAVIGNTTGNPVTTGYVGEYYSDSPGATVAVGASAAFKTILSRTLHPGVWMATGEAYINFGSSTGLNRICAQISLTDNNNDAGPIGIITGVTSDSSVSAPVRFINISVDTAIHLVGRADYSTAGSADWSTASQLAVVRIA